MLNNFACNADILHFGKLYTYTQELFRYTKAIFINNVLIQIFKSLTDIFYTKANITSRLITCIQFI